MDELKKRILDFPTYIEPHADVLATLDMRSRYMTLSSIPKYRVGSDRFCLWCRSGAPLKHHARVYCGDNCKKSANMFCYPQSNTMKAYILIEFQQCACTLCGLSYEDRILRWIERKENRKGTEEWEIGPTMNILGYQLSAINEIDVDHKIPLHRGGIALGLDNIQAVCRQCHKDKTFAERKR